MENVERPSKARLFIYDRKEVLVLILIGTLIAAFAFTFGIHLGKRVAPPTQKTQEADPTSLPTEADKNPTRQQLAEQGRGAHDVADEMMNQALHDEVQKTGVKLATPKPVNLPDHSKSKNAGATTAVAPDGKIGESHGDDHGSSDHSSDPGKASAPPKFALQIGSFPTIGEARAVRDSLESQGLKPFLKSAKVHGKGGQGKTDRTWYRVFLGSYLNKDEAEQMGERYKREKVIDSYVIANIE